jgi:hypothetical protein
VSLLLLYHGKHKLTEIDCTCSIDTRDESTWGQGGDCEYGSMIALEFEKGDGRNLLYSS